MLLSTVLFFTSCAVKYRIGMTETEFLELNKRKVRTVQESLNYTVYIQGDGYSGSWFYYFVNGKLAEVNEGRRDSDIIIENR